MKIKITKEAVQKRILQIFRRIYKSKESDAHILAIDPNSYDRDPAEFYEALEDEFPVSGTLEHPNDMSSEGIGGTLAETIQTVFAALHEAPAAKKKRQKNQAGKYDKIKAVIKMIAPAKKLSKKQLEKYLSDLKTKAPAELAALKVQAKEAVRRRPYDSLLLETREYGSNLDTTQLKALAWFIAEEPDPSGHLRGHWPK